MTKSRLFRAVAALAVGLALPAVAPAPASAALKAPGFLNVARDPSDVHRIRVSWRPVPGADHYVVSIRTGTSEHTVTTYPSTTSYTFAAPDDCTAYRVVVGAADARGAVTNTGVYSLRELTPGAVMGLAPVRAEEGTVASASWRAPVWKGHTALTGYRVVLTRLSDNVVLSDQVGTNTSVSFPDIDPTRAYTLAVSAVNDYGSCTTAKSLLDRFRPKDPTDLLAKRDSNVPGTVRLTWKAGVGGPPQTYYQVTYKNATTTNVIKLGPTATSAQLALDVTEAWAIQVKAYNENGGSNAATAVLPVFQVPAEPGAAVNPVTGTATAVQPKGTDRTAPTISATLSQQPVNGWFTSPTTIHFTCADNSGTVASCPDDIVADTDGAAVKYTGVARDAAGNSATLTMTMKIDQKGPAIATVVNATPTAAGWYNKPLTVSFLCSDEVSEVDSCPAPVAVRADGAGQVVRGVATDNAGNTTTTSLTVNLDQIAPVIKAEVIGTPNDAGWFRTPPTIHYTCSDSESGITACPPDQIVSTDGADQRITASVADRAGNTATATVTVNLDRAAPVMRVVGPANLASYVPDGVPVASCGVTEPTSELAKPAVLRIVSHGWKRTVTCTGAVDTAGNAADPVQATYEIAPTVPWLVALTHRAMPQASAAQLQLLDADLNARHFSTYMARVSNLASGRRPVVSASNALVLCYWALVLQSRPGPTTPA